MKHNELETYAATSYLSENEFLVNNVRPIVLKMITALMVLPENSDGHQRLKPFREALMRINELQNDIGTEERESILETIYQVGSIVGLDAESRFAEQWRGDW